MTEQPEPLEPTIEMYQSESLKNFAPAMCEVQKNDLVAKATSLNPYYNAHFANLPTVWDTIRKPLTDNGFCVIQSTLPHDSGVIVVTTLLHKSGEWMRGKLLMPTDKRTPQAYGSVMSFGRRYALSAMVGVSSEYDDDDAESATNHKSNGDSKRGHTMLKYTLPTPDSDVWKHVREYKPNVAILNKEGTSFKIGKYLVETLNDGNAVWSDVPKFGTVGFKIATCIPCAIAIGIRKYGAKTMEREYGFVITEYKADAK